MFPVDPKEDVQTQPMVADLDTAENPDEPSAETKKRWAIIRQHVDVCKNYRKKLVKNWSVNIDYRRGKPFASQSDDDTIAVNMDWAFTKTKHASLFSQIPQVHVAHSPESLSAGPWVANFERRLNDKIVSGGIEATMDECLPDCINAAGIGVALVSYEAITEDKEVPSIDLNTLPPILAAEVAQTGMLNGQPIPKEIVPQIVDKRYTIKRISPSDFLWVVKFTGSDFDNAPLIGHTDRIPWAEAVIRFGLKEEDKQTLLGDETTVEDRLSHDYDREKETDEGMVGFDEMFYKEYFFDTNAKSYTAIHHIVFLHGKTEPVIDEPWKGQRIDQKSSRVIGALKYPLRVLTLAYVTDETIPPSDTAIGRAQVNEINKGRTQSNLQRKRSIPTPWFDVNRLDPAIQQALMRGTWQGAIPVQGDGSRILGEVARAHMPQEHFAFDRIAKQDLQEQWTIGSNQVGAGGEVETRGEADVIQANFMTKIGRERAKVASFFVGIAQVLGGYLCLYEDPDSFGDGFDPAFSESLVYSILADSTVLIDSNQRLERLNNFVDTYAKSGWVNLEPVLKEIATLVGLDPNTVIIAPKPSVPEPPNISLRLTGSEDMTNPLLLAFLLQSGQAPSPELIEKAKQLIQQAVVMPQPPQMPGGPPTQGGPQQPPIAPVPGPVPGGPVPMPPPTPVGEANPQMSILPTIGKRSEDPSGE